MAITPQIKQHIQEDLDQLEIILLKMEKRTEGLKNFIKETREALKD